MPGVIVVGPTPFLSAHELRRLGEVEPFEFHPAHRHDAELFRALQHALQHLARTDRGGHLLAVLLRDELAEEERHAAVPRHGPVRAEVDLGDDVGKALVPARQRRVVVGDVHHVPAEHDVAEAESAFRCRIELVLVHVLAAQHPVDVGDGDLDAVARRVADGGDDLGGRQWIRHAVLRDGRAAVWARILRHAGGSCRPRDASRYSSAGSGSRRLMAQSGAMRSSPLRPR